MFWSFVRWKKHIYTSCSVAEMKVLSFFIWKSQYCVEKVQWWWLWLSQGWRVQGSRNAAETGDHRHWKTGSITIGHTKNHQGSSCEDHEPQWIERWAANRREGQDTQAVDSWDFWQTLGQSGIWPQRLGEDNLDWFFRAFNSTRIYEIFLKRALDFSEVGWSLESSRLQVDASCVSIINRNVGGDLLLKTWKTDLGVECIGFFSRGSPRFYGFIVWTSIIGGSVTQVSW